MAQTRPGEIVLSNVDGVNAILYQLAHLITQAQTSLQAIYFVMDKPLAEPLIRLYFAVIGTNIR